MEHLTTETIFQWHVTIGTTTKIYLAKPDPKNLENVKLYRKRV